ncbi:hypothetical protein LIER_33768 [Lithospermum erythrorhizon]|uniref:DUF4283 domain-containing protein n=1 Tax=Lithospermum erythrorhizon TaxID=34254 RepID=A0AAV3S0V8_LITER
MVFRKLQMYIRYGYRIPLSQIDEYWKTLDIEFPRSSTNETYDDDGGSTNGTEDDSGHTRIYLLAKTEDICTPLPVKQKKKLGSIRIPSAWERVMRAVGLKNSSNKKAKWRVAGINASQDSPIDISKGSRMNVSERTRMSISQGHTSPSTPKTPTSKPPRSPNSVIGESFALEASGPRGAVGVIKASGPRGAVEEDIAKGISDCQASIVLKIYGIKDTNGSMKGLLQLLSKAWNNKDLQLIKLEPDLFQAFLGSQQDCQRILSQGPWSFENHLVATKQWERGIQPLSLKFNLCPFWIQENP